MDHIVLKNQQKQQMIFDEAVQMIEFTCQSLSHFCCQCCQMTGMTIRPSWKNGSICTTCQASHANRKDMIKNLPIWYNENNEVQYELPKQLKCLREGEKLSCSLCPFASFTRWPNWIKRTCLFFCARYLLYLYCSTKTT